MRGHTDIVVGAAWITAVRSDGDGAGAHTSDRGADLVRSLV